MKFAFFYLENSWVQIKIKEKIKEKIRRPTLKKTFGHVTRNIYISYFGLRLTSVLRMRRSIRTRPRHVFERITEADKMILNKNNKVYHIITKLVFI